MPTAARDAVAYELDRWAQLGVEGHFGEDGGWYAYHERFASPLSTLLGTENASVVAMNSLTANLHLMLVSFYQPKGRRRKILIERSAFPSDRYAAQSHLRWHSADPSSDLEELDIAGLSADTIVDLFESKLATGRDEYALALLPGVQFLTGQRLPMADIADVARRHGVAIGFDLAHAVGNMPLELDRIGADFAVWCSYKYLNAGPGAIGGCYVHHRWHDAKVPRFEGWWGHDKAQRFALDPAFRSMGTAESWQLSNPPILAMAPLSTSLDTFLEAGIDRLRQKSIALTGYLEQLLLSLCGDQLQILTPGNPTERGCQLSIRILLGKVTPAEFLSQLAEHGVIADWREPDILRLAPVPLYNRFEDVFRAANAVHRALDR